MRSLTACVFLVAALLPLRADTVPPIPYRIDFHADRDIALLDEKDGIKGLFLKVKFTITLEENAVVPKDTTYKVIIEEDGHRVKELDVPTPTPVQELAAVLAIDNSGSMKEGGRLAQARAAAETFLSKLPGQADCGLILFDHEILPPVIPPRAERPPLLQAIAKMQPRGGTAYLDAADRAVDMLKDSPKQRRAVVLVTDGLDLSSKIEIDQVIARARKHGVTIFTIGIGEAGTLEPVNSMLVLDHSGSMKPPADDSDKVPKIKALHQAASRYVDIMAKTGRAALIPFSSEVGVAKDLSTNKNALKKDILNLEPKGETALFDAIYSAVATLDAAGPVGKRVVVAMTDGIDNSSRHRVEEVIACAREAKIPLYLLGFGKAGEFDAKTMKAMADATGGKFEHAQNEKKLFEIFENWSIHLHDDGIDEAALQKLAHETGGQYYHAKYVADLKLILEGVTKKMQVKPYEETFKSIRPVKDGTARKVSIKLVRRSGEVVSNISSGEIKAGEVTVVDKAGGYSVQGVVIAEMNYLIYLVFLVLLGGLIILPSLLKHRLSEPRSS